MKPMTSKERFLATIERRPVDRPAWWLGAPLPETEKNLCGYYKVADAAQLKKHLDDDVVSLEIPFHKAPSNHIACAFDWAKTADYHDRTLTSPGFFEGREDMASLDEFAWPDPSKYMNRDEIRQHIAKAPKDKALLAMLWSCHLQDACAAFGMQDALMAMLDRPELFRAVIDRITQFYLAANAIVYEAAGDLLDAVLIGNDVGCQTGLMISPDLIREFMLPGTRALIAQAHKYNLKVIHHSCGSIRPIIDDLVAAGADAIHPIQALATGMAAEDLAKTYKNRVSFCGGLDVQHLMVHGPAQAVADRAKELTRLFPTGLIISPSHEALLPDVPPEHVEALRKAMTGA